MNVPTPADAFKASVKHDATPAADKKPFVRPEHLMHRPFQQNDELRKLQSNLHRSQNRVVNPKSQRQR